MINKIVMICIAVSAVIAGVDRILGNRLGLGEKFDNGFKQMGPVIFGMTGILCLSPLLVKPLRFFTPFFSRFGMDPAVLAGINAIDMGGYQLAAELAVDPKAGKFAGLIISATFGCTFIFTIPVGFAMMREEGRAPFIYGILCGLITMPVTFLIGGPGLGLTFGQTLLNSMPVLLLSLLIIVGILRNTPLLIRIFTFLARVVEAAAVIGILAGLITYLTGWDLIPGIMPLEEALRAAALCAILLIGSLPFAEIINRVLRKPLCKIGSKAQMESKGITGLLLGIAAVTPALAEMSEMKDRDITINAAFLVSAAAMLGPHLGVCQANDPEAVPTFLTAKIIGGILAAITAGWLTRNNARHKSS